MRSASDADENREGEGGGIVHALIELGVTDEQVKEAQSASGEEGSVQKMTHEHLLIANKPFSR